MEKGVRIPPSLKETGEVGIGVGFKRVGEVWAAEGFGSDIRTRESKPKIAKNLVLSVMIPFLGPGLKQSDYRLFPFFRRVP